MQSDFLHKHIMRRNNFKIKEELFRLDVIKKEYFCYWLLAAFISGNFVKDN